MTLLGSALCALLAAPCVRAQPSLTVGSLGSAVDGVLTFSNVPSTFLDLAHPAEKEEDVTNGTVYWAGIGTPGCPASLDVKFYRPDATGTSLTFLDQRGPFNMHSGLNDFTLSPPVSLIKGDLLGATEFGCGGIEFTSGGGRNPFSSLSSATENAVRTAIFQGDTGTASLSLCGPDNRVNTDDIAIIARTQGTQVRVGTFLIVGKVQGGFNSHIVTSGQLTNTGGVAIQGNLIYHLIGDAGLDTDPSMPYTLGPYQVLNFPDIVGSAGLSNGGPYSVDVMASSSYAPLGVFRIFNQLFNGSLTAGSDGYSEYMIAPGGENVIEAGQSGTLLAPDDPTEFRYDIGARSYREGAAFNVIVRGPDGSPITTLTKSLLPDQMIQTSANAFLGLPSFPPSSTIQFQVTSGAATVWGNKIDNITNNNSNQIANKLGR
jgi:hypothetical protein